MAHIFIILALASSGLASLDVAHPAPSALITPGPNWPLKRSIQKRNDWTQACQADQTTDCLLVGVSEVVSKPEGHYIPACPGEGDACGWIGYADPTSDLGPSTSYQYVTSADVAYIVPVAAGVVAGAIAAIPPPPPEPPQDGPVDGPDDPPEDDDFPTIQTPSTQFTCETSTVTQTTTYSLAFNDALIAQQISSLGTPLIGAVEYRHYYSQFDTPSCSQTSTWCYCYDGVQVGNFSTTNSACGYATLPPSTAQITPAPPTPTPPPPKPEPYAEGTCGIAMQAQRHRNDGGNKYWVNIRNITDNDNKAMKLSAGWQACQNECQWGSALEDEMKIAVVGANDAGIINYIQFYLGAQQWRSTNHADSGTTGKCDYYKPSDNYNADGWNNEGYDKDLYDYVNLHCTFQCKYSGGASTFPQ